MSRIRTPRHFIYNEYDIMKEIQEPDKSHFVEEIIMEIRYIASSDDRTAISRIYEESWKHTYKGIVPQDYLDAIPVGLWAKCFDDPGVYTLIFIENGRIVGTSSFSKSRSAQYPDSGEVISIYFLPEYIGRGYGSKLMGSVLDELKKRGFKEAFLWTLEDNDHAKHFYESNGFSCTEDFQDITIGGKKLREVRYTYRFEEDPMMQTDDYYEDIHDSCLRFQR